MRALTLAVGLLYVPPGTPTADQGRMRVELALKAASNGHARVETFETGDRGLQEDVAFQDLEAVAVQVDAAAVVFAGEVDLPRLHEVAERVRMVVIAA